ncbi:patatin-like phospholipase domain-containing protein 4 [Mytilus galloprovincialis]|uniref:Patatin-like phospholipase domain-containing protein 4 n=1 Tax=Mytilus galloprovincialis TaxID=29158 RepID=A0A8B6EG93_MYTGA|nr:patatin-like phospholipase domain-containing protein 4 [Mytilus galloprovincialis]
MKHGASFLSSIQKVAGASAGALVASVLVIDDSKIEECKNFTYGLAKEVKSKPLGALTPGYNLLDSIKTFLNTMLPEDAHQKASGKLYISLTNTRTRENVLVHQYPSREHLIKCLLASSHIPLYASRLPVKIDGQKYMDGGITDNMVVFKNERTIQVSPFCGRQDISPNDKLGKEWYVSVNNQGFQVNKNNLIRFSHAMIPPSNKREAGNQMMKDVGGKPLDALKVISRVIVYFKYHSMNNIQQHLIGGISSEDIYFVLTVPASWGIHDFMKEAASMVIVVDFCTYI